MSDEIRFRLTVCREKLEEIRKIKMDGIITRGRARWREMYTWMARNVHS